MASKTVSGTSGNDLIKNTNNPAYHEDYNLITYTVKGAKISGGLGDDIIYGDSTANKLYGNEGNDTISGGRGKDTIYGGLGQNEYVFMAGDNSDIIYSTAGADDTIVLSDRHEYNIKKMYKSGKNLVITFNDKPKDKITVKNYYKGQSAVKNIQFKDKVKDDIKNYLNNINIVVKNNKTNTIELSNKLTNTSIWFNSFYNMNHLEANVNVSKNSKGITIKDDINNTTIKIKDCFYSKGKTKNVKIRIGEQAKSLEEFLDDFAIKHDIKGKTTTNNKLTGTKYSDDISGGNKKDVIKAGLGNDIVYGWAGNDTIYGGAGNDTLYGGKGNNILYGDDGDDTIICDSGYERNIDKIYAGKGNDVIQLGNMNTIAYGDEGDDEFITDSNYDCKFYKLNGGDGNDTFEIHGSDNQIYGDAGNDTITAYDGAINDTIEGGMGDDLIVFNSVSETILKFDSGDGHDTIHFNQNAVLGQRGIIEFKTSQTSITKTVDGDSLIISYNNNQDSITIDNYATTHPNLYIRNGAGAQVVPLDNISNTTNNLINALNANMVLSSPKSSYMAEITDINNSNSLEQILCYQS